MKEMHSDLYFYLRDRRHSQRYDRAILRTAITVLAAGVMVLGFALAYGITLMLACGY